MNQRRYQPSRIVKTLTTKRPKMSSVNKKSSASSECLAARVETEPHSCTSPVPEGQSAVAEHSSLGSEVPAQSEVETQGSQDQLDYEKFVDQTLGMVQRYQARKREDETNELLDRIEKLEDKVRDYETFIANLEFVLEKRRFSSVW